MKIRVLLLTAVLVAPSLMHADKNFIRFPALKLGNEPRSGDASALRVGYRYEQSTHARALGGYFGPLGKSNFWLGGDVNAGGEQGDVPLGNLLISDTASLINVITNPSRVTHNVNLEGSLAGADAGWSLDFCLRLQEVKQALRPVLRGASEQEADKVRQYLLGNYALPSGVTAQSALLYQRFYEGWQSVGGADSLSIVVEKRCHFDGLCGLSFQIGADLPLHRQREYSYVFQPDFQTMTPHLWLRTTGHYAAQLSPNLVLQLTCAVRAGYFVPFEQARTFSTYGKPFSPYRLLGLEGQPIQSSLIPSANVLTIPSRIKQGINTGFMFAGELQVHQGVLFGGSYSINASSAETVRPIQSPLASQKYAYASQDGFGAGGGAFGVLGTDFDSGLQNDWLRPSDLDLGSAAVSATGTQEFSTYAGYQLSHQDGRSLSWRVGGSYCYAQAFLAQNKFSFFTTLNLNY